MTVIAARKFDDFAAASGSTGQPQGRHDRLGAGVDHADHFHTGHLADQLRHLYFYGCWCAEAQALFYSLHNGARHFLPAVAQNQRTPGADQVDVFLAVHVPDMASQAPVQEPGIGAHASASPHRRIDTARQDLLGSFKQLFRFCHYPKSPFFMAWASSLAK